MLDSSNPNSWSSAVERHLDRSTADFSFTQETKAREDKIDALALAAWRRGWSTFFGPAKATPLGGTSGGVAVSARKGIGLTPHPHFDEGFRHRLACAWAGGIMRGGVHLVSVYLQDSIGMTAGNIVVMEQLAAHLASLRGP